MSYQNNDPICPDDCTVQMPPVDFSECAPEINLSQIKHIYTALPGYPFADWTNAVNWADRVSNTSSNLDAIRKFNVIGSKPRPQQNKKKISLDRTITGAKNHIVNIKIDETNDTNYENIVRASECGGGRRFWYETMGGKLYGGNEGVLGSLTIDDVLAEGGEEIEIFEGEIEWTAKFHPERIASPIA